MRMRLFLAIGLAVLGGMAGATARDRAESLAGLVGRSDHVALVRCVEVAPYKANPGGLVFTRYRFEVQEPVAGKSLAGEVTLRVVGGLVGTVRVTVPDAPRFRQNGAYLVMLRPAGPEGRLLITGAAEGVWPARQNPSTLAWEVSVPRRFLGPGTEGGGAQPIRPGDGREPGAWLELPAVRQLLSAAAGR